MKELLKRIITYIKAKIKGFNSEPRMFRRLLWYFTLAVVCIFSSVGILVALIWAGMFGEIPSKKELTSLNQQIASEVYSAESVLLGRY